MAAMIKTTKISDELIRPNCRPPLGTGFVSKSPKVAPSGRVRMKASQNSAVWEIFVNKWAAATKASAPAKISAPPP